MAVKTHVHKVKKSGPMWRCVRDNCKFFVYFKQQYVLDGKICSCWNCGAEFMFSETNFDDEFPSCTSCKSADFAEVIDNIEKSRQAKIISDAHKTDLEVEMDRLRNEMTGEVDDDILRQIAKQNIEWKDNG